MTCGVAHPNGGAAPHDAHGCRLEPGHPGPHEFVDQRGTAWQWDDTVEFCDTCQPCNGHGFTEFWRKPAAT